jgi:drug/metabolite transporter (DMT)-like permease
MYYPTVLRTANNWESIFERYMLHSENLLHSEKVTGLIGIGSGLLVAGAEYWVLTGNQSQFDAMITDAPLAAGLLIACVVLGSGYNVLSREGEWGTIGFAVGFLLSTLIEFISIEYGDASPPQMANAAITSMVMGMGLIGKGLAY